MTPVLEDLMIRAQVEAENRSSYTIGPRLNRETYSKLQFDWFFQIITSLDLKL